MSLVNQLIVADVPDVIRGAVMVIFIISAVLVILVVLAQEGKGGGLAGAFGGAGADTFGVKAGTVNKFTAYLAAAFLGLALLHAGLDSFTTEAKAAPSTTEFETDDKKVDEDDGKAEKEEPKAGKPGGDEKKKDEKKKNDDPKKDG